MTEQGLPALLASPIPRASVPSQPEAFAVFHITASTNMHSFPIQILDNCYSDNSFHICLLRESGMNMQKQFPTGPSFTRL